MTDRIHVLATFDSPEDLLDGMRRAKSWIKLDEASALGALATEDSLRLVLAKDYSEREIDLLVEMSRRYADNILAAHTRSPESIA